MKLAYEAANSLEAHMILDLLEQHGITGRLEGEHLVGGLGELPAVTVRVMVEEQDFSTARVLIEKWNQQQPSTPAKTTKNRISFGGFLIGVITGMIAVIIYYRMPISETTIDHNNDGKPDEFFGYYQSHVDRNFDGEIDYEIYYKKNGAADYSKSDENFDGRFETTIKYEHGNLATWESDRSGIGFSDYVINYKNGVIDTETFYSLQTNNPIKINYFDGLKILKSEIDSDNDGRMDTIYEYDSIGEITKRYKME